jgi:hypothetical protein
MRGGDKARACKQFLDSAELTQNTSLFMPVETLTPFALVDISEDQAKLLISTFQSVPKENMLLLILGETIKPAKKSVNVVDKIRNPYHKLLEQPFVKSFPGPKTILFVDPEIPIEGTTPLESIPVVDKQLLESNIETILLLKAGFPLTPVYGPHVGVYYNSIPEEFKSKIEYGQPNVFKQVRKTFTNKKVKVAGLAQGLRRFVFPNAVSVLNVLVDHPGPLLLNSRITSVCYRSFKYILDIRQAFERPTLVLYEYSTPHSGEIKTCNTETSLFSNTLPGPFETCGEFADVNRYYTLRGFPTVKPEHIETVKEGIMKMDQWTNQELQKYIPKKPSGGSKRTKTRRRKH